MRWSIGVSLVAFAATAHADGTRLAVVGDACPEEALKARVSSLAGYDPFDATATSTIVVRMRPTNEGVAADVWRIDGAHGSSGTRELTAADCTTLIDRVAVVVAVALAHPEVDVAPASTVELEHDAPPTAPMRRDGLTLLAGGGASTRGQASAFGGAELRRGALALGWELQIDASESVMAGTGRARVSRGDTSWFPCVHLGPAAACASLAVGWISGRGEQLADARAATTPFVAIGGRLAVEQHLGARLSLRLHVDVRAPLTTNRFLVDDMVVWSTRPVEGLGGLALVAHIP